MSTFNEWKENSKRLEALPELSRKAKENVSYLEKRLRYHNQRYGQRHDIDYYPNLESIQNQEDSLNDFLKSAKITLKQYQDENHKLCKITLLIYFPLLEI